MPYRRTVPSEANAVAHFVNATNAERIVRGDRAAAVVVAVVIGALLACAVPHFATPCEGAALCSALITPTRSGWWRRVVLRLEAWRLRLSLADHEATLERVDDDLAALPLVRQRLARNVDFCRIQLADCEAALQQGRRS